MRCREFERLVVEALDGLPRQFRRFMRNIAVIVETVPSQALLETMGLWPDHSMLGL